jgi:uncharacterized protein (DUF305 family)
MTNRTGKFLATAAAATLLMASLTACAAGTTEMGHDDHMSDSAAAGFSGDDIMFAQMMIPHHQQAVDMGTLAETRATNPEVKAIAAQIKAEQAPEIEQMKKWLTDPAASSHMGHSMGMDGMLSEAEMTTLENATGAEFDRLFVQGMIAHHEGAIEMAQMILNSKNAEAKALGEAIVSSQTAEVVILKQLLAKL